MPLADALRQLAQLSPGIVAGLKGDGNAMKAFMDAYQQTSAQFDEQDRQQQLQTRQTEADQRAMEDRQRLITRQTEADRLAAEDRRRRQALEGLQVPGQLAQLGATADTPEDAQRLIESALPQLMSAFGQESMAYGMPAVQMAQQTITSRQKAQMRQFVDAALKTAYVADNPDADPELIELPAHIAKMINAPTARLSQLQKFAELPVGKPQGKDRMPAASGSFEEYSDPKTTAERRAQIEKDRKAYMQADDRAPRVTVNTGDAGGLNPYQQATMTERMAKDWEKSTASTREVRRQYGLMQTGLKRFKEGDKNGGSQAVLVTFQKILDPASVVRESEYARSPQGLSVLARIEGYLDRLMSGGAGVPESELAAMVETGRQMLEGMQNYNTTQRTRIDAMAKKYQIDPVLIYGIEAPAGGADPAADPLGIRKPR